MATDKQIKLIKTIISKYHISAESIVKRYGVKTLEGLYKPQASDCISLLKKQVGEE